MRASWVARSTVPVAAFATASIVALLLLPPEAQGRMRSGVGSACPDRASGGGWLVPGGPGDRAFGFSARDREPGKDLGRVEFHNHTTDDHLVGEVATYIVSGPATRTMLGRGSADGEPATFSLTVTDNGEPGTADTFALDYSTQAGSPSEHGTLGGGNIAVRPCT